MDITVCKVSAFDRLIIRFILSHLCSPKDANYNVPVFHDTLDDLSNRVNIK